MPLPRPRITPITGALLALLGAVALMLARIVARVSLGFGPVGDFILAALLFLLAVGIIGGVAWAIRIAFGLLSRRHGPRHVVAVGSVGLAGVVVAGMLLPTPLTRVLVLAWLVFVAWIGAAAGILVPAKEEGPDRRRRRRRLGILNLTGALGGLAAVAGWVYLAPSAGGPPLLAWGEPRPPLIEMGDPGEPGPWEVASFTYGSGRDARRPEYADGVLFTTPTVNLAPLLPTFRGWEAQVYRTHWGFGLDAIPLNARVWHPRIPTGAPGPSERFPVVLLVAGIDPDSERAELGYAYLGELLASRGYVVVAPDVNFLGRPRISARAAEMPVRAWLVLEHLQLMREWKAFDPGGLPGWMDLEWVAVVGHSRGGEAAALAALLNQLERYPDNAAIPLSFGFGIRSVVALAPTDRSYRFTGRATTLHDVSYLVLHGSQDGDVVSFLGTGQYQRMRLPPTGEAFRASVYVVGANHANFSAGRSGMDHPGMVGRFLDRRGLLPAEDQRRITAVMVSAFLDATLNGEDGYRALFRDPRLAGDWLPATGFVTRYDDGRTLILADFEEDLDPSLGTLEGVRLDGRNLTLWREEALRLRDRGGTPQENTAVLLGWRRTADNGSEPLFEVLLSGPPPPQLTEPGGSLVFSLGSPSPSDAPPDLSVEVWTLDGRTARIPLSAVGPIANHAEPRLWRLAFLERLLTRGPERLLQSYEIPLSLFEAVEPALDVSGIRAIRFVFDRTTAGTILLDDVGLRGP
jgi:MFS family permease